MSSTCQTPLVSLVEASKRCMVDTFSNGVKPEMNILKLLIWMIKNKDIYLYHMKYEHIIVAFESWTISSSNMFEST